MNADPKTQWWLSSGPPQPSRPEVHTSSASSFAITPEIVQTGLNLATGLVDNISKVFTQNDGQILHDVSVCGVCPVCVALKDLKKKDPELASLIESALAGVTTSYEKIKERLPDLLEPVTRIIVDSLVQSVIRGRFS